MSYAAIDMHTVGTFNTNPAFNQVACLKALDSSGKFLVVEGGRLKFNIRSGRDVHIPEDLYPFISYLFRGQNKRFEPVNYKILKAGQGHYLTKTAGHPL